MLAIRPRLWSYVKHSEVEIMAKQKKVKFLKVRIDIEMDKAIRRKTRKLRMSKADFIRRVIHDDAIGCNVVSW